MDQYGFTAPGAGYAPGMNFLGAAQQLAQFAPPPPELLAFAAPGAGYTPSSQFGPAEAPQGGLNIQQLLAMLGGGGGMGMGAALNPRDYQAPGPYMGGIGGKPAVQPVVAQPQAPKSNVNALLAYLGGR